MLRHDVGGTVSFRQFESALLNIVGSRSMKPSPLGSKLLSGYAILFAGLAPMSLAIIGLAHGVGVFLVLNVLLGAAIVYFGVRVFVGDYAFVRTFAFLVILYYLALTAANVWNFNAFPADSRAAEMAIPRMIRGVLFAGVFAWYYLFRSKTAARFGETDRAIRDDTLLSEEVVDNDPER